MPLPKLRYYYVTLLSCQNYASTSSKYFYSSKGGMRIVSRDAEVVRYLKKQFNDSYSKLARLHEYRARSAFKLLEMNEKLRIVKPGDVVVDIGAAPGSWCQVLSEIIFPPSDQKKGPEVTPSASPGYILGVDLQPISPINNVDLLSQANITKQPTQEEIRRRLNGRKLNAIFSDMAPNCSGEPTLDHYRIISLCRCVLDLMVPKATLELPATLPLFKNGKFLCKVWDGPYKEEFMEELKKHFKSVKVQKPVASRDSSAEIYLYSSGFVHN